MGCVCGWFGGGVRVCVNAEQCCAALLPVAWHEAAAAAGRGTPPLRPCPQSAATPTATQHSLTVLCNIMLHSCVCACACALHLLLTLPLQDVGVEQHRDRKPAVGLCQVGLRGVTLPLFSVCSCCCYQFCCCRVVFCFNFSSVSTSSPPSALVVGVQQSAVLHPVGPAAS